MRDFSGHHHRKTMGTRERFGPYSDPTAREAMRAGRIRDEEAEALRRAFFGLLEACHGRDNKEIVEAAMRLYTVAAGA